MRRVIALSATTAALTAALVASNPAAAESTTACTAPWAGTDHRLANVVSTVYQLPAGNRVTVTRQTDPLTAAYAAERGTLVLVCQTLPPRRSR